MCTILKVCQEPWELFSTLNCLLRIILTQLQDHFSRPAQVSCIRHLSVASTKQLMSTFILSRLDYGNSHYFDLSDCSTSFGQNNAACIIFHKWKVDCVTSLQHDPHQVPVQAHIKFKIVILWYLIVHGLMSVCLSLFTLSAWQVSSWRGLASIFSLSVHGIWKVSQHSGKAMCFPIWT